MSKREIIYLIVNVPFCIELSILFYVSSMTLQNRHEWNPRATTLLILFFVIAFALDLAILKAFKIIGPATILMIAIELFFYYLLL